MVGGITPQDFAKRYPRLFHMATEGSWASIQKYGLLSTSAILDLYGITGAQRNGIERNRRASSVVLEDARLGRMVIRDQKPLIESKLRSSLRDGLTVEEWILGLNRRVFFWVKEERLGGLRGAREYRPDRQTVLVLDTVKVLERNLERVLLTPLNTGATNPMAHPRGKDTFKSLQEFPFADRLKTNRKDPVVELTVDYSIPDAAEMVVEVWERGGNIPDKCLVRTP